MSDAQIERTVVNINTNAYSQFFVARGEVIKFDGFLRVYNEGTDDEIEEEKGVLPVLTMDENLNLLSISSRESFSRPPSRYTEASLVKKLEELGIGRPATYATTISTIQIDVDMKEKLKSFGQKDESYQHIIEKLYNIAVKEQLREFLYDQKADSVSNALARAKAKCQE